MLAIVVQVKYDPAGLSTLMSILYFSLYFNIIIFGNETLDK